MDPPEFGLHKQHVQATHPELNATRPVPLKIRWVILTRLERIILLHGLHCLLAAEGLGQDEPAPVLRVEGLVRVLVQRPRHPGPHGGAQEAWLVMVHVLHFSKVLNVLSRRRPAHRQVLQCLMLQCAGDSPLMGKYSSA